MGWHNNIERLDAWPVLCYELGLMAGKIALSLLLAMTIILAPAHLSARTCIFSSAPSEKACQPGSCANKTCCATSQENRAPVLPPPAKDDSSGKLIGTWATASTAILPIHPPAIQQVALANTAFRAHAPPTLASTCICLI